MPPSSIICWNICKIISIALTINIVWRIDADLGVSAILDGWNLTNPTVLVIRDEIGDIIIGYTRDAFRKPETFTLILHFLKLETEKT